MTALTPRKPSINILSNFLYSFYIMLFLLQIYEPIDQLDEEIFPVRNFKNAFTHTKMKENISWQA